MAPISLSSQFSGKFFPEYYLISSIFSLLLEFFFLPLNCIDVPWKPFTWIITALSSISQFSTHDKLFKSNQGRIIALVAAHSSLLLCPCLLSQLPICSPLSSSLCIHPKGGDGDRLWFSNFRVPRSPLEDLLKHSLLSPTSSFWLQRFEGEAREFA